MLKRRKPVKQKTVPFKVLEQKGWERIASELREGEKKHTCQSETSTSEGERERGREVKQCEKKLRGDEHPWFKAPTGPGDELGGLRTKALCSPVYLFGPASHAGVPCSLSQTTLNKPWDKPGRGRRSISLVLGWNSSSPLLLFYLLLLSEGLFFFFF